MNDAVVPDTYILPMSPAQQRLWFLDQMDPGTTIFNIPVALRFSGTLDVAALGRAFSAVLARHEVLRTTLTSLHGDPVQVIHPYRPAELPLHDLSALPADAREAALLRELRAAAAQPFDLARGPLVRLNLWRLGDDQHALMIVLHHAIADGWSLGVLYRELAHYYQLESCGGEALPELAIQYADYAQWHRERMASGELDRQRDYWLKQLQGYRGFLDLPTDRPRPPAHTFDASAYEFRLGERQADSLKAFSKDMGVTLFVSTIAAYALLLSRYSGQRDICVGIPVAGRNDAALEELIGFFVNGLVIRFRFDPHATVREMMNDARNTVLDGFANQDLSVDSLFDALHIPRSPAYEPLVQATFALQNFPRQPQVLPGIDIAPIQVECMHSRYDLMLLLTETPETIAGNMVYNTNLFEPASIARMMEHLSRIIDALCAAPDATLDSIAFVTQAELYAILGVELGEVQRILPLNAMQRDIYVDALAHPDSPQNTIGGAFEIHGEVDPAAWRELVQALVDAQPVLRTRIRPSPVAYTEAAYQCVLRSDTAALEVHDFAQRDLHGAALQAQLDELIRRPYDPHGPLVRHHLIKLDAQRWMAVLVNHHLLLDGISTANCLNWLAQAHTAAAAGNPPPDFLPPDLFHEQLAASRQASDTGALLAYWRDKLAGVAPPHCPGAAKEQNGARIVRTLTIPAELWADIRHATRQQRITPQIFLKAVFGVVADAHCQCDGDLLIAEFTAGRGPGHGAALGCYYQALPFVVPRARLAGDARFTELLDHTRAWQKEAPHHAGLSIFEQRRLAPLGRTTFMFNFITAELNVEVNGQRTGILRFTPHAEGFVQFEISMSGDDVLMTLNYPATCFAETHFLERMLSVARQALDGSVRLGELSLLLPGEGPAAPEPWPEFVALTEQIARQAASTPEAPAIVQGSRVISYAELLHDAHQLAHALRQRGAGPGERVGICMERSPEMIVALLAALFSGAAYVPMDAAYPAQRLQRIAGDADCRVIVTQECLRERLADSACPLLAIDGDEWRKTSESAPLPRRNASDAFYVLYTSGSTGLPKGAVVSDDGAANLVEWYRREFAIGSADRILVISAFGFDLTQKNFFAALTSGATLVLPQCAAFDPADILASLAAQRATLLNCAPSAFAGLLEDPARYPDLASLRRVFLGGEPIRIAQLEPWLRSPHCHAQLVNTYGPTECTDVVAYFRLAEPFAYLHREVPIGMPVDHALLSLRDAAGREAPPYGVGEICIGGLCVGQGYWHDEALTREKFVELRGADGTTGRYYRSGDLAYRDAAGLPVYLGRRDFQVKVRGQRIELGEIEAALHDSGPGEEWLVLALHDQLVAYLRSDAPPPSAAELRTRLGSRLPEHMLPNAVIGVPAWPLGAHGKVDRAALARLEAPAELRVCVPPQTPTEIRLAKLWGDALGRSEISRDDNFFSIGGHSLLAARIVSRIRSEFGVELPLRALFDAATVVALASRIDALLQPPAADLDELLEAAAGLAPDELEAMLRDIDQEPT